MRECEFRKNNLRPWTLWSGSKPSCIKRQALVLLARTCDAGEARFRHHRREAGQAALGQNRTSQVGAVSWSQQKHRGSSFLAKARSSQFDKKNGSAHPRSQMSSKLVKLRATPGHITISVRKQSWSKR